MDNYDLENIELLDNSRYTPTIDPTYVALGYLDEYLGRMILEDGRLVERFYPGERGLVAPFVGILHDIADQHQILTSISEELRENGHIDIISPELCRYFTNLYSPRFDNGQVMTCLDGTKRRYAYVQISQEMFPKFQTRKYRPEEVDCRFSYLIGCHARYGCDNALKISNARHKVKLIIDFLETLGASWIKWSWTVKTAPVANRIQFGPDAVLARVLDLKEDLHAQLGDHL